MIEIHNRETPPGFIERHAKSRLEEALSDTRIAALIGPRQSGKTTLVRAIAIERGMDYVTLDDAQYRNFANDDPVGFTRGLDRAVIDEIQRAPDLILALKQSVDEDSRSGRFLITGSVDLFSSTASPDSLAGRVETVELLPLSQSELELCSPSRFLAQVFGSELPRLGVTGPTSRLQERIFIGGYPEVIARRQLSRQQAWLSAYAKSLTTRDAVDLSTLSDSGLFSRLLEQAALLSGQLVNLSALARPLAVDSKTIDRWLLLLEHMFLLRRVRAWHRNDMKRLVKAPKLHFIDSGLLAVLKNAQPNQMQKDRTQLGALLEGFVYSELIKQCALYPWPVRISHYRDKDKVEVDFVLESMGRVVGVEVKAAASVNPAQLKGLNRLREATGESFCSGIVLHDGDRIQQIGERLYAVPIGQLWANPGN